MTKTIPEIIEEIKKEKQQKKKIEILKSYKNRDDLKAVLKVAYHPAIKLRIPDTRPPFNNDNPTGLSPKKIANVVRLFPLFVNHPTQYVNLKNVVREQKFIEMLESVSKDEAEVLCQMIERKIIGISKTVAYEAFPGMFKE